MYEEFIQAIKDRLSMKLADVAEHNLDEKYIASACRDYAEALRALESARLTSKKEV